MKTTQQSTFRQVLEHLVKQESFWGPTFSQHITRSRKCLIFASALIHLFKLEFKNNRHVRMPNGKWYMKIPSSSLYRNSGYSTRCSYYRAKRILEKTDIFNFIEQPGDCAYTYVYIHIKSLYQILTQTKISDYSNRLLGISIISKTNKTYEQIKESNKNVIKRVKRKPTKCNES